MLVGTILEAGYAMSNVRGSMFMKAAALIWSSPYSPAILFQNSRGAERIPIDVDKLQINIVRMPRA